MSGLPPGFTLDTPPQKPRKPGKPARLDTYTPGDDVVDLGTGSPGQTLPMLPGSPLTASGRVVDGDTFGLTTGRNARLYGIDAYERGQLGYRPGQKPINLGDLSAGSLSAYIRPSQSVLATGKQTYGRPVVTLGSGQTDPALDMLFAGTARAAPEFLRGDPERRAGYMEAERLARLNRQGAYGTQHLTPRAQRLSDRWNVKLRPGEEMAWTADLPELRPEFQRLSDAETEDYGRFLAGHSGNQNFGQADLDAYWQAKGRQSMAADPEFIASVRKGDRYGTNPDYSAWDAQTLHDFKLANGFAGLRPEVQEAYGNLLGDPKATAATLKQFADVNGLTFDPRDVDAYFSARAKGEKPNIPIPIINPGDGARGAFGRGFVDPVGILDEMGAGVDVLAPQWMRNGRVFEHRENIWNSDRSLSDIYENNLRQNRAIIDYDETQHPYARFGGQLGSGALIPFGGGVRSASGLAKLGGAWGGAYGFGSGDGDLIKRLANVPVPAAVGATGTVLLGKSLQAAAPYVGKAWGKVTGRGADMAPVANDVPARTLDRIDIPGGQPRDFAPTLGDRVPSAYPGPMTGKATPRDRGWIDVQQHEALPPGFKLDQMGYDDASRLRNGLPNRDLDAAISAREASATKQATEQLIREATDLADIMAVQDAARLSRMSPAEREAAVNALDDEALRRVLNGRNEQAYIDDHLAADDELGRLFDARDRLAEGPPLAMDAEPLPSISGPRTRDVIDVNASRTTRLLDGPTDAMRRAAAARVEPGDVLPRAANEIGSVDEAAALGNGPYPEVKAPRERDYLETSQFPSRANPENMITRKGPTDLVTFMRSLNGVRDDGGELTAAGISNAARKGEDFAGGENRLGKLVNPEGIGLDEAAERAWRGGYFPELDAPPTNAEFVAALDDTYRGVGRRFLPEDEAQIQAFEAARDQRLAVERARLDGAPLADDIGQPATLDDMVRNTPPATAYDDWNNAVVSKVGNIRVNKLETPEDIGQALKIAENVAGGFDAATRGKISFAETQQLAQDLGMTADDLLARRKGQAMNAEEAYAARAILAKSTDQLVRLAGRIQGLETPGDELLAAFRRAFVRHTAIQEQVSGATAEAGRALSAFRLMANSKDAHGRILESIVNGGGGAERLKDAAKMIVTLERDPANMNRFIEAASKPGFKDKLVEVWYNFLLSGPQTHAVNMLSNTMTSIAQIPEHAVAAGVGAARRALRRDAADRVLFSEVGARTIGLIQGAKQGLRMFANALRTGEATDFVTKMEHQGQKAVSGLKGEVLRLPSRFLTAEDELFKGIARRMELNGLAVRKAAKEGLKGQEAKDRVAELMVNPTDDMMLSALDYGRYVTFQAKLGPLASKASAATNELPVLKLILPFVRTPTNLFKFFVERSPAAPLMREFRKDFMAGGAKRDLAIAKVMVGSGLGATMMELASKGLITGSAPKDKNKRGLMEADGWQPYSFKIGDTYYSYKRLDPFALTIGAAADLATMSDGLTERQLDDQAAMVTASILGNLTDKTWLSGISSVLAAVDDPERSAGSFVRRLAGSVSVPTGVAQTARAIDPASRETPGVLEAIQNRIPGLSDSLLPKRDVWGREIVSEGGVGPDILSPIWTKEARNDPITKEVLRVDATVSKPQKIGLTPEQYDRLQAAVGPTARKWLGDLFASPEYRAMTREDQAARVGKILEAARKAGKANVLTGEPMPAALPDGRRRKAPTGLPPGFEVDALPPGFTLDR